MTIGRSEIRSVYDPTMGSGSLLLRVGKAEGLRKIGTYYGQELNGTTYNLARMNMLMHNVNPQDFDMHQGDTLEEDAFANGEKFDVIVANPPYSASWNPEGKLDDERFRKYGKTAPKSKADFAFVEHMLYHLKNDGTMAVVLPHGVLFRGVGEGVIRKYMIEQDNVLDAVIGLPANLFYGTSIPTVVLVFKKNRENNDVFFIDASNEFEKGKNQNSITDEHLAKIVATYKAREDVEKYAHKAELSEIQENDFNLNVPRYVDTFEEEAPVDVEALVKDMNEVNQQIAELNAQILADMKELVGADDKTQQQLEALKDLFK